MQMESSQGGIPTFLSTHPDPGDRYTTVTQLAGQWKDSLGYNDWQVNEDNYLQMIDGMVYGEDPRQGYVDGNAFYHPEMKFQFPVPAGWQLENSPLQVQMAPKEGNAMMIFSMARQDNLDEAAETTLSDLELNVLDSERTTVNGMPAISAVSDQTSQNQQTGEQQTIKVVSYFIDYNDAIYVFHGVSTGADFNSWFRTFESTMMNFNRLTDPAKLNVQPKRINVRRVQRASTLAQALDSFGVPQSQMDDLALLNNMELTDRVQAGKLLKTIVE